VTGVGTGAVYFAKLFLETDDQEFRFWRVQSKQTAWRRCPGEHFASEKCVY